MHWTSSISTSSTCMNFKAIRKASRDSWWVLSNKYLKEKTGKNLLLKNNQLKNLVLRKTAVLQLIHFHRSSALSERNKEHKYFYHSPRWNYIEPAFAKVRFCYAYTFLKRFLYVMIFSFSRIRKIPHRIKKVSCFVRASFSRRRLPSLQRWRNENMKRSYPNKKWNCLMWSEYPSPAFLRHLK